MLGAASAVARLEQKSGQGPVKEDEAEAGRHDAAVDVSELLNKLDIGSSKKDEKTPIGTVASPFIDIFVPDPQTPVQETGESATPKRLMHTHPALQIVHTEPEDIEPSLSTLAAQDTVKAASVLFPQSSYLRQLTCWAFEAPEKIRKGECEIPATYRPIGGLGSNQDNVEPVELNQNDLYLGPGSVEAIEGCVKTVCQGIDVVCAPKDQAVTTNQSSHAGAFCIIRPPGHHCSASLPSGFCFVNNVVTAAMHAYLTHNQDRAIFIDIDLHHGNGTQDIVINLNEKSWNEELLVQGGKPLPPMSAKEQAEGKRKRNWKGFYGSLHDINSYPCEDGSLPHIKEASIKLAAHGQYIENIHLETWSTEQEFYDTLYETRYKQVLRSAERFVKETQANPERTVVIISAGFDACEHEYEAMSRHQRQVPVSC